MYNIGIMYPNVVIKVYGYYYSSFKQWWYWLSWNVQKCCIYIWWITLFRMHYIMFNVLLRQNVHRCINIFMTINEPTCIIIIIINLIVADSYLLHRHGRRFVLNCCRIKTKRLLWPLTHIHTHYRCARVQYFLTKVRFLTWQTSLIHYSVCSGALYLFYYFF